MPQFPADILRHQKVDAVLYTRRRDSGFPNPEAWGTNLVILRPDKLQLEIAAPKQYAWQHRPFSIRDVSTVAPGRLAGAETPATTTAGRDDCQATAMNHVWAYDFVFDTCADGRSLKCLTLVDEFTRECVAIDVARSIRSDRVIEVLSQLVSVHGAPRDLRSDNGPEFVATAILRWVQTVAIETAFIDPGKPWQNGTDESFNGKFRNECLTLEWFRNRLEATVGIDRWRRHYNEERPQMSLGDLTPAEFKRTIKRQSGWLRERPERDIHQ